MSNRWEFAIFIARLKPSIPHMPIGVFGIGDFSPEQEERVNLLMGKKL